MNILILVTLFILLLCRIKYTPMNLSKTVWKKRTINAIERNKQIDIDEDERTIEKGIAITISFFVELFLIIFYIILGNEIDTTEFIVLSELQIISCLWELLINIKDIHLVFYSTDINDFTYRRFNRLFNLILDYIYYPWAIYMLLK